MPLAMMSKLLPSLSRHPKPTRSLTLTLTEREVYNCNWPEFLGMPSATFNFNGKHDPEGKPVEAPRVVSHVISFPLVEKIGKLLEAVRAEGAYSRELELYAFCNAHWLRPASYDMALVDVFAMYADTSVRRCVASGVRGHIVVVLKETDGYDVPGKHGWTSAGASEGK